MRQSLEMIEKTQYQLVGIEMIFRVCRFMLGTAIPVIRALVVWKSRCQYCGLVGNQARYFEILLLVGRRH